MRTLEITTAVGCPNICSCCPQEKLLKVYNGLRRMSFKTFRKILHNTPRDVRIDFSGFCEPFINSETVDMILEAWDQRYRVAVFTTGLGLKIEKAWRFSHVLFETFEVHLQDEKGISRIRKSEDLPEVLRVLPKIVSRGYVQSDLSRIRLVSRAGNVEGMDHPNHRGPISCKGGLPQRFVVLPDGRAVLCCMDYGLWHVMGNLTQDSYDDLMVSVEYDRVLDGMRNGGTSVLCHKCEFAEEEQR